MVKTKVVNKKAPPAKAAAKSQPLPKSSGKKVAEPVEVKANKDYRPAGDWWDDILSGETCRTGTFDKVVVALGRSRDESRGLNVQAIPDRGTMYWYITLIVVENETKKGKRK